MDAKDFLIVAKKVLGHKIEASFRTSISRSYYAAYNFFSKESGNLGVRIPKSPNGHMILVENFFNSGVDEAVEMGRKINDLRAQRKVADYDLDCLVNQNTAELVLQKAQDIIDKFGTVDKPALKSGIETYQQKKKSLSSPPTA